MRSVLQPGRSSSGADETSHLLDSAVNFQRSPTQESAADYKARWRSIRIAYFTIVIGSLMFSIFITSLWPYLQHVDDTSTSYFLGWLVSSYSLAQMFAATVFGWTVVRFKAFKFHFILSIAIVMSGCLLYAYVLDFNRETGDALLLLSRVLMGLGAGNAALSRAYVADATTLEERTSALANINACQGLAFVLGPVIQTALVPLGYPGPSSNRFFPFNMYTAPAFLSFLIGLLNVILLVVLFQSRTAFDKKTQKENNKPQYEAPTNVEFEELSLKMSLQRPNMIGIIGSLFIFFMNAFIFSLYETVSTPLVMHMYAWSDTQATFYNGIIFAVSAILSILTYIGIKPLAKRFEERKLLIIGILIGWLGTFAMLPWGDKMPARTMSDITPSIQNQSVSLLDTFTVNEFSEPTFQDQIFLSLMSYNIPLQSVPLASNHSSTVPIGCPYDWCAYVPVIYFPQYLAASFLVTVGFSSVSVMSFSVFSKIIGPRPQGVYLGILTGAGCLARTLGPLTIGILYANYGPRVSFLSSLSLVTMGIFVSLGAYKKMKPFED